ncbi:MAG: M48 family metallopeptidase [Planctomycetes bacterium]|nr:M48 family metallopeptidase [Planctomycetota bacterium]
MASPVVREKGLRDPLEGRAFLCLVLASVPGALLLLVLIVASYGAWLFFILIGALAGWMARGIARGHLRANAVRVSRDQLPLVHEALRDACTKLGMEEPECYVVQETLWNAFAARLVGRPVVVLYSGVVDALLRKGDVAALSWLVAHEVGHVAAGHLDASRSLLWLGGWIPWLLLWHSRRCEFTCDRIAHFVTGDGGAGRRMLVFLGVGEENAGAVDVDRLLRQWWTHRDELFVRLGVLYSTHPPLLARIEHLGEIGR